VVTQRSADRGRPGDHEPGWQRRGPAAVPGAPPHVVARRAADRVHCRYPGLDRLPGSAPQLRHADDGAGRQLCFPDLGHRSGVHLGSGRQDVIVGPQPGLREITMAGWSPDGRQLVFTLINTVPDSSGTLGQIITINSDGSGPVSYTHLTLP